MSVTKAAGPVLAMPRQRCNLGISRSRCRNLFGPIDHEQLRSEQREELRRIQKEKERRWNFDFVNLRPLVGNFEWERIGGDRSVAFTTIASQTEEPSASSGTTERSVSTRSSTSHEGNATNRTRQGANSKVNCLKTPERTSTKPQRRSPRITDYLRGTKVSSTASRQIKFGRHGGDERISTKQVRTSSPRCRGRISKQSTLDEVLSKLRPRHANGRASS